MANVKINNTIHLLAEPFLTFEAIVALFNVTGPPFILGNPGIDYRYASGKVGILLPGEQLEVVDGLVIHVALYHVA